MSTTTQIRHRTAAVHPVTATLSKDAVTKRVPTDKPAFTLADLRRAIPPHCFQRSLILSFGYLLVDLTVIAILMYATTFIGSMFSDEIFGSVFGPIVRHVAWIAYWWLCGAVMTGVWVIGHECGHSGFAEQEWINDTVGMVVHSALLVPFFAWKISHRRHHSNTGSIEHDEVHVPSVVESSRNPDHEPEEDGSIRSTIQGLIRIKDMFVMLVFGWPFYLIMNVSGNQTYAKGVWVNHFDPKSPIFNTGTGTDQDRQNARLILISDLGMVLALSILGYLSYKFTFGVVFYTYGMPYLVTNFWLVAITFLQHTDTALPHYNDNEWDWLRGALATIDRDYGSFLNMCHHHIQDTHVLHHLFSYLPHYHAEEATEAIKPLLGNYYRMDRTPWYKALWTVYGRCSDVRPDPANKNVYWF